MVSIDLGSLPAVTTYSIFWWYFGRRSSWILRNSCLNTLVLQYESKLDCLAIELVGAISEGYFSEGGDLHDLVENLLQDVLGCGADQDVEDTVSKYTEA